ncbi:RCC1 domain-containing protein [Pigmentibacter ruber]|uniref:RCC1 domain-containing protein n=1 Tax=Pigmentibacter ruber TaxID=2683196 RepID=UPI00131D4FD3|nr:hypothetical protein [Pigmentibacter ruber]
MKSAIKIFFVFIFFLFIQSCSDLSDLEDPGRKDDPISLSSFVSLQDLANKAILTGTVQLYSSMGTKSGLITVGDASGCVVMNNGRLKCWGQNDKSQLGDGTTTDRSSPVWATSVNPANSSDIIVAVVSGRTSTCAYYYTGLKCWGNQTSGVLGNGQTTGSATTPQTVTNVSGRVVKFIQLNDGFSCIQDTSGVVSCWGDNSKAQLGNGNQTSSPSAAVNASINGVASQLIAQNNDSCALVGSVVKCWGQSFSNSSPFTPVSINFGGNTPSQLGGGTTFSPNLTCVVMANSTVQCFGATTNSFGELGNGTNTAPANATTGYTVINATTNQALSGVMMVATGDSGTNLSFNYGCAVADDFTNVYCWGNNSLGNLGNGSTSNSNKAVKVTKTWPSSDIIDLAVSDGRACILLKNNDVWCWGGNSYGKGELGNGSLTGNTTTAIKILNRNDP